MHRQSFVRAVAAGAVLALLLGAFAAPPLALAAGPIGITTTTDSLAVDGACSLREAIRAANLDQAVDTCPAGRGADRIRLPAGTYTLAIAGVDEDAALTGDLDITADLTITGAGRDQTIVDAAGLDRVFDIFAPARVRMTDLTVTGGYLQNAAQRFSFQGGGIASGGRSSSTHVTIARKRRRRGRWHLQHGRPVMTRSTVTQNSGGAGIASSGDAWLDRVEISGNFCGAARTKAIDPNAGGIAASGYLLLTRSVVSGNSGGGEWTVGGVEMGHGLVLDATISGNTGTAAPGGIEMTGAQLVSSTVSGNAGGVLRLRRWGDGDRQHDQRQHDQRQHRRCRVDGPGAAGGVLATGTRIVSSTITGTSTWAAPPAARPGLSPTPLPRRPSQGPSWPGISAEAGRWPTLPG